ncbi:hypothetical protein GGS23DRAFT_487635 [Durotheca rogersii]|uniref:uncharacterized protein n=1 Tax=Durotheca rogersii TaxID=419775 RepID=UPI00221FD5C0|nr:uncharacterized protein GGS23DRAFT_487635 [Durotheca rogersii]KAI5864211.1 hypothetical protein GGS23DRAFT_487635 [Durotheca rogersii]
MEEATKTIKKLAKNVLPPKAHYLSLDTTRYRPHSDERRLEEQDIRPLQYTTFLSDADRGILLTRAAFDVREDAGRASNATNTLTPRKLDPNKPKTKLSLKDYKNRKRSPDAEAAPKPVAQPGKPNPPPKKLPEPMKKDMEDRRDVRKDRAEARTDAKPNAKLDAKPDAKPDTKPDTKPDAKPDAKGDARRLPSPSLEKRKRIADSDRDLKPVKRPKVENATAISTSSRPPKENSAQKQERLPPTEKKQSKDSRPATNIPNGKPPLNSTGSKGVPPKPDTQVNGSQKHNASKDKVQRRAESTPNSKSGAPVPPLLSPINMSALIDPESKASRPSPKKKLIDPNSLKAPLKRSRDDREPSPAPKKRKIPPLLSPTLPAIVLEELARSNKLTPLKDSSQRSSQVSESPKSQKKAPKSSKREDTIHVDSNKGQRESFMVTLKYKKRNAKTVERLLALPPGGRKKNDLLKRDDRAARDRSISLEPGTARKRPIPAVDISEASKRPKTSESLRPSTPPRQSSAMTRVASNSSQAGTPGAVNGLTPAAQAPERRRPPVDLEKLQKLQSRAADFIQLATKLKHERDGVLKLPAEGISDRDRQVAIAAGVQCLVSFLLGFKLQSDASDLERRPHSTRAFRELLALFRVTRADCARHNPLTALILRLQGVCLVHIGRIMWSYPNDPEVAKDILANSKEQQETWRLADNARRVMGVYDGSPKSDDGGTIGKLIDRLGPWTMPEETAPVTLEVLRKLMQGHSSWKPAEALSKACHSVTNGVVRSAHP